MKTIEDIQAELQAIIDAAVDGAGNKRNFKADEIKAYEALESELAATQASAQLRQRNAAYNLPANSPYVDTSTKQDDGLEKAYDHYLRTGQPNADISGLRVRNAQGEGTGAAGGYMVPPGFRQKIVERMVSFGGFAAAAETITTDSGAPLEYPTLDDTGNEGAITPEGDEFDGGADLEFGDVALGAYKYTSTGKDNEPLRVPVELLQDSAFDVQALVSRALGTRIARKQASHWVTGTGVTQPKGIVAASLTADRALDTDDTPDYQDLVETQDLLDESYEQNAAWLMHKTTWSAMRLIVDTNGRPIIQDSTAGIAQKPQRMMLGSPVIIDQAMPQIDTAANTKIIAYGDFRESYVIRRVASLVIVVNPYSSASSGKVEYSAWERADGTVQNRHSYVILSNDSAA
jgi:HK97 family phage major capsid protein